MSPFDNKKVEFSPRRDSVLSPEKIHQFTVESPAPTRKSVTKSGTGLATSGNENSKPESDLDKKINNRKRILVIN